MPAAVGIAIKDPPWIALIENAALLKREKEHKENRDSMTPMKNAALREAPMAA